MRVFRSVGGLLRKIRKNAITTAVIYLNHPHLARVPVENNGNCVEPHETQRSAAQTTPSPLPHFQPQFTCPYILFPSLQIEIINTHVYRYDK